MKSVKSQETDTKEIVYFVQREFLDDLPASCDSSTPQGPTRNNSKKSTNTKPKLQVGLVLLVRFLKDQQGGWEFSGVLSASIPFFLLTRRRRQGASYKETIVPTPSTVE